jgi:serine/threonine protein kinase
MEETTEIGYGLDGCVYKPGFCESTHKHPGRSYVSKVFKKGKSKVDAETQRYASLNLSSIDPEMKYFISEPEVCKLNMGDSFLFNKARKEEDCKAISQPYYAVNYIDGGQDLFVILNQVYDMYEKGQCLPLTKWNEYLYAFKNVFQGIKILNENEIYHMDIKPDNIVFDNFNDPPLFKLIDFGLSHTEANPPTKTVGSFKYIPPEMYMFPNPGLPDTKAQYNYYFNQVSSASDIILTAQPELEYYEKLTPKNKYEKADVWALGITLIDLYNTMVECPKYTDAELAIYLDLGTLAYKMIDPFVLSRISITAALMDYIKFLVKLETYVEEQAMLKEQEDMQDQAYMQSQAYLQDQAYMHDQAYKRTQSMSSIRDYDSRQKTKKARLRNTTLGGKRRKYNIKKTKKRKHKTKRRRT